MQRAGLFLRLKITAHCAKLRQTIGRSAVGGGTGVLSGTDGIAPCLGQFQQIHPLITADGAVLVQPVPQQRQQTAAQHAVSPHDDSVGVVLAYQRQKVSHSRRQPGSIGRGKAAVIGQGLLKAAAGLRIHPGRTAGIW